MALSLVWSLLNTLQLLIHLPLFSVQFPGFAFIVYEQLINVATFDLISVEALVVNWFDLDPYEEAQFEIFERLGYG